MFDKVIEGAVVRVLERVQPDGGFAESPQGTYRPDATAWAVIALSAWGGADGGVLGAARARLAAGQAKDGRVPVATEYASAFWPTPLAVLAWFGSPHEEDAGSLAAKFLLSETGRHWKNREKSPGEEDPSIRAWPWIEEAASWVDPTAHALLALRVAGHAHHKRAQEAVAFLLDRQLKSGGWNYGNTVVYGQGLYPQTATTGMAMAALAALIDRSLVEGSIQYLRGELERRRSPLSLGWGLIGLSSWGERPPGSEAWISESLGLQEKYGMEYGTSLLSLLILASGLDRDLPGFLEERKTEG
jgi:hypothetical protein